MKRLIAILLLLWLLPLFTACQNKKGSDVGEKKLKVITTLFPLYDFSREIAGEKAEVIMLLPPGMEPHGFEPK
ncbi:MAG TPA: zinc ABC transporter substrate-binding protein, partial [Geobacteraceae bacterium]|nr:zinc ABC transporter substrate-binding protein [Geobacteraceae bacterium]